MFKEGAIKKDIYEVSYDENVWNTIPQNVRDEWVELWKGMAKAAGCFYMVVLVNSDPLFSENEKPRVAEVSIDLRATEGNGFTITKVVTVILDKGIVWTPHLKRTVMKQLDVGDTYTVEQGGAMLETGTVGC